MFKREKSMMLFGLGTDGYSFKGLELFLFVYIGATLFAALMTAPSYWIVEWINSNWPSETTAWLLGKDIDVYFDRMRWAPIIIGLPWVLAKCGLFSLRNLGISFERKMLRYFAAYFAIGICICLVVFSMQLLFTQVDYKNNFSATYLMRTVLNALLAGLILGFLEELVFRGLIMRSIYSAVGVWSAMILSSLFFAYKHFKVPNTIWENIPGFSYPPFDVGFIVAYYDTIGIAWGFNIFIFLSLVMFGMLLCAIYLRTRSLIAPMALHTGIVFSIQVYRSFFFVVPDDPLRNVFGNAGMTNSYLALVLLTVLFLVVTFYKRKR